MKGDKIKAYRLSGEIRAPPLILGDRDAVRIKPAPVVASFSGRGPNGMNPEILKPDLIECPAHEPMTDESTGNATTPYDFGAGHLNLDLAMDPGLVYDLRNEDYVSFLMFNRVWCKDIQVSTSIPDCFVLMRRKPVPENLNYPSIAALFSTGKKGVLRKTLVRRVRNVGEVNSVYTVKVQAPKGVIISVRPGKLWFSPNKVEEELRFTKSDCED
ncbi:subtilisin-like protease SBT1.6 [Tanacetum coccineum]